MGRDFMLPLAGRFTTSLNRGAVGRWLQVQFGYITWHSVQLTLVAGVVAFFVSYGELAPVS
ncbi:MAG: hypothetical protein R2867_06270 [Caldilineaceae bacterium]